MPVDTSHWPEALTLVGRRASTLISKAGWIQDQMTGSNGELCIIAGAHEANRGAAPLGLSHVLREILEANQRAESWNDTEGRTQEEVVGFLSGLTVTEDDLHSTFGPKWPVVCYLAEMFGRFSKEQLVDWMDSRNEESDYLILRHMDEQEEPDQRDRNARNAVCASASDACERHSIKPKGPSVALLVTKLVRASLVS